MTAKRELILQNVKTTLDSLSGVDVMREVKELEMERVELSSFPLLVITDGTEELVSLKGGGYRSSFLVLIYGYVENKDTPSSSLNNLLSDAKSALDQDITRGDYAVNSEFERALINPKLKHPYGGFILHFRVIYLE